MSNSLYTYEGGVAVISPSYCSFLLDEEVSVVFYPNLSSKERKTREIQLYLHVVHSGSRRSNLSILPISYTCV